jgi:hypothetical protein|tara:strand:- start:169 stop:462 length:294 start_codon:yes stop_codon:yes gene_type:complete
MLVKLTEVCQRNTLTSSKQEYSLQDIFVNPEHVVMIREDSRLGQLNESDSLLPGMDNKHRFTKLTINRGQTGTEIVVIGSPQIVEEMLHKSKNVIRG